MSKTPDPRQLPEHLRRRRGPVAAQQPGFWGFGPPPKGKGPKPIRIKPPGTEAEHEPPTGEAGDHPEAS
jgi:hypothetical protein